MLRKRFLALGSDALPDRVAICGNRRVGKANGSRERAPDDRLRVPTIASRALDGGHGARAPLPTLRLHPTGKSVFTTKTCPALFQKIFRFRRRANQFYQLAPSHPTKGRIASRHERGMGCGGRDSVGAQVCSQGGFRERMSACRTNGVVAYGKTVWSWHPLLVSSCRWQIRSDRTDQPSSRQRR
jgi:hypothetical protein